MRIERITAAGSTAHHAPHHAARADQQNAQSGERVPGQARGKALVALNSQTQMQADAPLVQTRPTGPFVAQLLANRLGLAQTRERRRLGAREASAHYGAVSSLYENQLPGSLQRRSI